MCFKEDKRRLQGSWMPKVAVSFWLCLLTCLYTTHAQNSVLEPFKKQAAYLLESGYFDSLIVLCKQLTVEGQSEQYSGWPSYFLAEAQMQMGNGPQARLFLEKSIQQFETYLQKDGLASAWKLKGQLAFTEMNFQQARLAFQEALEWTEDADLVYEILKDLALVYSSLGDHSRAIEQLRKGWHLAKQSKDKQQAVETYNQIYTSYYSIGQLDSAIYYLTSLINYKAQEDIKNDLLSDLSMLGNLYTEKGAYALAQEKLIAALKLAEQRVDTFYIMKLYTDIAHTNAAAGLWGNAVEYAQRAVSLAQQKEVRLLEAQNLELQADAYKEQGQTEQAIEQYFKSLEIYELLHNVIGAADVLLKLGSLYENQEDYDTAFSYIRKAIEAREGTDNLLALIEAKLLLGKLYLKRNQPGPAIEVLLECLTVSREIHRPDTERAALGYLATAFEQTKDYQKAYQQFRSFARLNDSLVSLETATMINDLDLKYKTDKNLLAQQIELNEKQNQIERQKFQLLTIGIILMMVLVLLAFLYFIYLKNRQLSRQKIETLNKEKQAQRLLAVIEGEERERKRIARDLHDDLGALLATVKIRINALDTDIPDLTASKNYQITEGLIDHACSSVREIAHNMVPSVLEQNGLEQAIYNRCEMIMESHGIVVEFISHGLDQPLDRAIQVSLYRIIQELLSNVLKHAHAQEVIVQLTYEDGAIMLIVEDDGKGFDPEQVGKSRGLGLESIAARVHYLDGDLQIDSSEGAGTTFTIHIPISELQIQS